MVVRRAFPVPDVYVNSVLFVNICKSLGLATHISLVLIFLSHIHKHLA